MREALEREHLESLSADERLTYELDCAMAEMWLARDRLAKCQESFVLAEAARDRAQSEYTAAMNVYDVALARIRAR